MIEKEFILEVMNYERITLGRTEEYFLCVIAVLDSCSAYTIFSTLKDDRILEDRVVSPMAYKNVHRRIKRLQSLGLIEIVPGENLHKAIRYRLTPRGLFQLLLKEKTSTYVVFLGKDNRHKLNVILQTILYQFFEFETIDEFKHCERLILLDRYLQDCSQAILSKVEEFRASSFKGKQKWLPNVIYRIIAIEIRKFVYEIVTNLKSKKKSLLRFDDDNKEYVMHEINSGKVFPTSALAKDKKFIKLVNEIKTEFDDGYKELSSFPGSYV